ncbi:MAG: RNA polymerase sigma factor [Bacillota bacterium]
MNVDIETIKKCKKNDKNAFMDLFKQYERYLYKLCFSYVQNEQDALDIMQEVYIKIFKNIGRFELSMPFHPWLRRIAVNSCINHRRTMKYNTVSLNSSSDEHQSLEEQLAADTDIEKHIENLDMERIIKSHLDTISPKHRMVIILRYYEDMSYEEIAEMLEIPLGTVKTDLYRARNILKSRLAEIADS